MDQDAVQSMVHDFRTPITVIKGNLQLLLSGVMGHMSEDQFMLIRRSVGPLEDLILMTENLLYAATLEKSELTLKLEEADLDKLLSDTIGFYSVPFKQREMEIYRDGNTFGTRLRLDPFWMKRVLNNLIWNAYNLLPTTARSSSESRIKTMALNSRSKTMAGEYQPTSWKAFSRSSLKLLRLTANWAPAWVFGSASRSWNCTAAQSAWNPKKAKAAASSFTSHPSASSNSFQDLPAGRQAHKKHSPIGP